MPNEPADERSRIRYRARPFVCGAVGAWEQSSLARLVAAAPTELEPETRGEGLVLYSSMPMARWDSAERRGWTWGALADGPAPRHWRDAAERRMAAGAATGPGEARLHTDALGMQDLYCRRIGDAVYFAARMEPLLDITPGRLHVNWDAWASTMALTSPVGDDTPFEEIRRVRAAHAWTWSGGRLREEAFEPSWMDEQPDAGFTPEAAVEALDRAVRPSQRTEIAITGGWDSRILGVLARRRRGHMTGWTTSSDDGRDRDLEYAAPVAAALGLDHQTLIPGERAWLEEYATVRHRSGFQTVLHTWMMPLARELHGGGAPLLDGLAGDVLFKATSVTQELADERDPERQSSLLWETLENQRLRGDRYLRPEVAADFADRSRNAFREATRPFGGHPAAATLGKLQTRTARSIAAAPLWLMAPEIDVEVPFLHPEVVAAAIRVPLKAKIGGDFYREMLRAADPSVADLPSTNDPRTGPAGPIGPRRQTRPESLRALCDHIRSVEPVRDLFTPAARAELLATDVDDPVRGNTGKFRVLTWASVLAQWFETHQGRLAEDGARG